MGLYRWQMYINICSKIVGYHCSHYLANENDVDMCFSITRSHGSVTSVVRATREVNGRRQIYPSHHTHIP